MTNFSERLELILKIRKLKAYELSLKTKLSQPLISQYLSGKFEPKNDKAYIIAEALDVDISWLMGFSDELKPFEKEKGQLSLVSFNLSPKKENRKERVKYKQR